MNNIIKYHNVLILTFIIILTLVNICGCKNAGPVFELEKETVSENTALLSDESCDTQGGKIYVHISGEVNAPGVIELDNGARLFEAVNKAGGFTDLAADDYCNLAQAVSDGSKYYFPTKEEASMLILKENDDTVVSHYDSEGKLNINVATKDELMQLPGIGKSRAEAITEYREQNGLFASIEDLKHVSGIKDNLFGQICEKICVQ